MILRPTPICSSNFSFKDNCFVAELSELGDPRLEPVYDDACDYGFTIISEKTEKAAVFCFERYDGDGEDVLGLWFSCVTPGLEFLKALLINDW